MPSARPSLGATSTAPEIGTISTAMLALGEEAAGRVRVGGRDPVAGEVLDGPIGGVVRDSGRQAAAAVAERADARQFGAGLGQEVDPGDPEIGDPVAHELDDVVGADEQDVEVEVLDEGHEAPVVLLEDEAGVVQEAQGRLDQAALVRDRQAQAAGHRSPATG